MARPTGLSARWRGVFVRRLISTVMLCAVWALPVAADAQMAGLSLDLTEQPVEELGRIAVVPPHLPSGAVDLVAYRNLLSALSERYGARLVPEVETLRALRARKLKPVALRAPEGARWLARQLEAKAVVAFTATGREVEVRVFATLADSPEAEWKQAWRTKLPKAQAEALVAEVIEKADSALTPPAPPPIPERAVAAYADPPPAPDSSSQVAIGDIELEARREAALEALAERRAVPVLRVAVGGGATTRDLQVAGSEALSPINTTAAPGLGLYLAFYPLQLAKGLADRPWSELVLEGHLRRSLVQATVRGGEQDGTRFAVNDDEVLARLGWSWRLGEGLPAIGFAAGWGTERTTLDPSLPAVSTRYQAIGAQLRVQQPLFRELLGLELLGGPRWLMRGDGADAPGASWDAEAWLTSQPTGLLFARAGARVSRTRLGRADGLEVHDLRTFFALELGVFLR